jgi:hypothetical protein
MISYGAVKVIKNTGPFLHTYFGGRKSPRHYLRDAGGWWRSTGGGRVVAPKKVKNPPAAPLYV